MQRQLTTNERNHLSGDAGLERFTPVVGATPGVQIKGVVGILRRRSNFIISVAATGVILVAVAMMLFLPRYTATALMLVGTSLGDNANARAALNPNADDSIIDTHISRLLTREQLQLVAESLAKGLPTSANRDNASAAAAVPQTLDITPDELGRGLRVSQERRARVLAIKYTSRNAADAALIVNRVVDVYIKHQIDQNRAATNRKLISFAEQSPQLKSEFERAGAAMSRMMEDQGIGSDAQVLSLATPPESPSTINPVLLLALAAILFSALACLLAVVMEQFDDGLRSERDVTESLGLPCIGIVPQVNTKKGTSPHQQLLNDPFTVYAEAIRSVAATTMEFQNPHRDSKVLLLTSSTPAEGKTTLAISLATYAASVGQRVLLIDLDCRNPTTHVQLGGKRRGDELALLLEGQAPSEVVRRTEKLQFDYIPSPHFSFRPDPKDPSAALNPLLRVLRPAGTHQGAPDPLLLFAGPKLPALLQRLRASYDCIIIDGPPLLAVTESRLLAAMVDKIIFAVRWGHSRRDVALNALSLLSDHNSQNNDSFDKALAVITRVDLKAHASYRYGDSGESFVKFGGYYSRPITLQQHGFRRWTAQRRQQATGT